MPEDNNLLIAIFSFLGIYLGSELVVHAVLKISRRLHTSSFLVSFLLLGLISSLTEVSVAFNSYINQELEISVGNLLGAIVVLFFLVVPFLAIAGNGIKLQHSFNKLNLILSLVFLILPSVFLINAHLSLTESIILIIGYVFTAGSLILTSTNGKKHKLTKRVSLSVGLQVLKIVAGSWILIMSSNLLVKETILLAERFGISTFVISLIGISLGTNLPEISLGVRSIIEGKKDVAFGNYLGSALFNVLILSVLGLVSKNNEIHVAGNFLPIAIVTITGLVAFYFFATSKREISRREGIYLLLMYIAFLLMEILYQVPA